MGCCVRVLRLARSAARRLRLRMEPEILSGHATDPLPLDSAEKATANTGHAFAPVDQLSADLAKTL
jgi:hypothetical protein